MHRMLFFILSVSLATAHAQLADLSLNSDLGRLRGSMVARDYGLEEALVGRILEEKKARERQGLAEAKFFLVNGEAEHAREILVPLLKRERTDARPMVYRYLAVAAFQEARWSEALSYLEKPELVTYPHFGKVCPLKVILLVANRQTRGLSEVWSRCKNENAGDLFERDATWMEVLVQLAEEGPGPLTATVVRRQRLLSLPNEDMKSIVKLALYLNQEGLLLQQLEELDLEALKDEELRAMVAQAFFRQGKLAQAWRFMQDISTPNVENMKGNLWLLRGNQELAYAQFKLALEQKANSHNAVERALPLAWSLRQWQEGLKLSERIFTHEKNRLQRLATTAAFAVAQEKWDVALGRLETIHRERGIGTAHEVNELSTYVALMTSDPGRLARYGELACKGGDLLSCWLTSVRSTWGDLRTVMERDDLPGRGELLQRSLASGEAEALAEETFVDQRDVDELDDALITIATKKEAP